MLADLPGRAQKENRIKIVYVGFANYLVVDNGRLDHSFAQHSSSPRVVVLQLSAGQMRLFEDWLGRCRVLPLTAPDMTVSGPNHPGAQEHNSLLVEAGGNKFDLSWEASAAGGTRARTNCWTGRWMN